jgi:Skp family chaperone for outer membrane proteins
MIVIALAAIGALGGRMFATATETNPREQFPPWKPPVFRVACVDLLKIVEAHPRYKKSLADHFPPAKAFDECEANEFVDLLARSEAHSKDEKQFIDGIRSMVSDENELQEVGYYIARSERLPRVRTDDDRGAIKHNFDFFITASTLRNNVVERDAKIDVATRQDICKQIQSYAEEHGISLVLKMQDKEEIGLDVTPSPNLDVGWCALVDVHPTYHDISTSVIYHNHPDITGEIIKRCNGESGGKSGEKQE